MNSVFSIENHTVTQSLAMEEVDYYPRLIENSFFRIALIAQLGERQTEDLEVSSSILLQGIFLVSEGFDDPICLFVLLAI